MRFSDYDCLDATSASELGEKVRAAGKEGWQLLGSVSVSTAYRQWENEREGTTDRDQYTVYAQAVYKP